jgi:hypothetical protein
MKYLRDSTLLALESEEFHSLRRVGYRNLPADGLLVYDSGVSNFFFEFDPARDIELFLQHAHFACISSGRLLACQEDLYEVSTLLRKSELPRKRMSVLPVGELPAPLRFVPDLQAFNVIARSGKWQGRLTCCSCGFAGCFSQYAWIDQGICLALFTIDSANLEAVEWCPFRLEITI